MKKFIATIICLGFVFIASSQQAAKTEPFRPGWYLGVNGGLNLSLAEGNNFLNPNQGSYFSLPDNSGLIARALLGYDFTKIIGIRGMVGFAQHEWPDVLFTNPDGSYIVKSFGSQNLTADLMVNLSNLWFGYNQNRWIDISAFAGAGLTHRNKADFSNDLFSGIGRGGLQGDIRLTNKLDLNINTELNFTADKYNDYVTSFPLDAYAALTVGFTYHFRNVTEETSFVTRPAIEPKSDLAELPTIEPIEEETIMEPAVEPEQLAKVEPVQPVEKVTEITDEPTQTIRQATELWVNIFYSINRRDIAKPRQKEAIDKVVDYLTTYPKAKIIVSGYADRETGSAGVNNEVSKQRAENVTKLLTSEYAIPADRIQTTWYGSRRQLFKQNNMNRLTTVNTEGAEPFKKMATTAKEETSAPQADNSVSSSTEMNDASGIDNKLEVDIMFDNNSAEVVSKKQEDLVMKVALFLRRNPDAKIVVKGYADKKAGTTEGNVEISKNRAINISNSLIRKYSIDVNRIQVKWYGAGVQPMGSSANNDLTVITTINN